MALNTRRIPVQILSDVGGAVNSPWFYVGGMSMDVQFHGPAVLADDFDFHECVYLQCLFEYFGVSHML